MLPISITTFITSLCRDRRIKEKGSQEDSPIQSTSSQIDMLQLTYVKEYNTCEKDCQPSLYSIGSQSLLTYWNHYVF